VCRRRAVPAYGSAGRDAGAHLSRIAGESDLRGARTIGIQEQQALNNMCGITGWADLDSHTPPPDGAKDLLHAMCERMVHRGPDSEELFVTSGVALGMRRLAIIDLVTGEQPAFNEDRSVAVILNGEIYNYRELRADLEK